MTSEGGLPSGFEAPAEGVEIGLGLLDRLAHDIGPWRGRGAAAASRGLLQLRVLVLHLRRRAAPAAAAPPLEDCAASVPPQLNQ